MKSGSGLGSLLRMGIFIAPYRNRFALFLALSSVSNLIYSYLFARIIGRIVADASTGAAQDTLYAVAALLVLFVCSLLSFPLLRYAYATVVNAIDGNMRRAVFAHVRSLPISHFDKTHSGDTLARLTSDMQQARGTYDQALMRFLSMLVSGIGGLIVTGSIHWIIMLSAIAIGGTNALINLFYIKPMRRIANDRQRATSEATQTFVDMLQGIRIVKVFGLEDLMAGLHETHNAAIRRAGIRLANVASSQLFSVDILRWLSVGGIIVIACILGARGEVSVEQIMIAGTMGSQVAMMLSFFSQTLGELQTSIIGAERIFEIMDAPQETMARIPSRPGETADRSKETRDAVTMSGVHFSYGGDEVLNEFSFRVGTGQVVALVGDSGSGKSTLCKLLLGLYQPQRGEISILGRDYASYSLSGLRELFAYVPQSNYLFNASIRDNIAWGRRDTRESEILAAATAALAHDFITELPDGYQTVVGERGVKLSGGQRQRVAIARALLKNARILLLDEATSSLDTESERSVQQAIQALMTGRTTIVVAHRLATVENADLIVVLENGSIVEQGTHRELIARNGRYAGYHASQFVTTLEETD